MRTCAGVWRESRRQREDGPRVERQHLERALQESIVRVVVRIDEARDGETVVAIDGAGVGCLEVGPDGDDDAVLDQDVGDGRQIVGMRIGQRPGAADQQAPGQRLILHKAHRSVAFA